MYHIGLMKGVTGRNNYQNVIEVSEEELNKE
jgi:hypothetical protein